MWKYGEKNCIFIHRKKIPLISYISRTFLNFSASIKVIQYVGHRLVVTPCTAAVVLNFEIYPLCFCFCFCFYYFLILVILAAFRGRLWRASHVLRVDSPFCCFLFSWGHIACILAINILDTRCLKWLGMPLKLLLSLSSFNFALKKRKQFSFKSESVTQMEIIAIWVWFEDGNGRGQWLGRACGLTWK